mmetsp:Transcript_55065/g.103213  ORF Transcript_55065/g.103213 Transcript_55065/m.103213 type:complete len:216 (-) Transcript_55065:85-732(-)
MHWLLADDTKAAAAQTWGASLPAQFTVFPFRGQSPHKYGSFLSGCTHCDFADDTKAAAAQTFLSSSPTASILAFRGQSPQRYGSFLSGWTHWLLTEEISAAQATLPSEMTKTSSSSSLLSTAAAAAAATDELQSLTVRLLPATDWNAITAAEILAKHAPVLDTAGPEASSAGATGAAGRAGETAKVGTLPFRQRSPPAIKALPAIPKRKARSLIA